MWKKENLSTSSKCTCHLKWQNKTFDWLSHFDWQAWDVVLQQTDNLLQHIKQNAQKMENETLTKLGDLISRKKEAKKFYSDERSRLETEFNKVRWNTTIGYCKHGKVKQQWFWGLIFGPSPIRKFPNIFPILDPKFPVVILKKKSLYK